MQDREFDNLMTGKPAKWAEISEGKKPTLSEVKKKEHLIPSDEQTRINIFIARCRSHGMLEKNIRKQVKKKFGIVVISSN